MKQMLIEIDDRCARDLERVAPAKKRVRAEFVRLAIRRAIDLALDRATEEAYRALPLAEQPTPGDLLDWDRHNDLAKPARARANERGRRARSKGAT
jgi:hypothetical protein